MSVNAKCQRWITFRCGNRRALGIATGERLVGEQEADTSRWLSHGPRRFDVGDVGNAVGRARALAARLWARRIVWRGGGRLARRSAAEENRRESRHGCPREMSHVHDDSSIWTRNRPSEQADPLNIGVVHPIGCTRGRSPSGRRTNEVP